MNDTAIRRIASAVCMLAVLAPVTFADEAVHDLIERIVERQATVQSIQQRGAMTISMVVEGHEEEMVQESLFIYQRPNRLVVDSDMVTLVSDGDHLVVLFQAFDYFIRFPIDEDLAATLLEHEEYLGGIVLPDIAALLSADPQGVLKDFVEDLDITVLDDEERDGRPAWVIQIHVEDDDVELAEAIKVWIDQETGLVSGMRVEVDLSAYADAAMPGMPTSYTLTQRVLSWAINQELDDELFAYDTTGFTEVADFDELADAMQGAMGMPEMDLIGEDAPDFELTLLDGESFRLSEQRGKVVLLDFWATWCPPCVESLPWLQDMYEEFGGDDIVFLGVSVDSAGMETRVKRMLDRFNITYPSGINEDGDIALEYGAFSIPTIILIDRDGVIRHQKIGFHPQGMEELKAELTRLAKAEVATEEE